MDRVVQGIFVFSQLQGLRLPNTHSLPFYGWWNWKHHLVEESRNVKLKFKRGCRPDDDYYRTSLVCMALMLSSWSSGLVDDNTATVEKKSGDETKFNSLPQTFYLHRVSVSLRVSLPSVLYRKSIRCKYFGQAWCSIFECCWCCAAVSAVTKRPPQSTVDTFLCGAVLLMMMMAMVVVNAFQFSLSGLHDDGTQEIHMWHVREIVARGPVPDPAKSVRCPMDSKSEHLSGAVQSKREGETYKVVEFRQS